MTSPSVLILAVMFVVVGTMTMTGSHQSTTLMAEAATCQCARGGTLLQSTPYCKCACTGSYITPLCQTAAGSFGSIKVTMTAAVTKADFNSDSVRQAISANLNVQLSKVGYRQLVDEGSSYYVLFGIPAEAIDKASTESASAQAWVGAANIASITEYQAGLTPGYGARVGGPLVANWVPLTPLVYVFAMLALCIVVPIVDGCVSKNTTSTIREREAAGEFAPKTVDGEMVPAVAVAGGYTIVDVSAFSAAPPPTAAPAAAPMEDAAADPAAVKTV